VLAAVSRRYPEPRGRFPRVTHPCATDGRNHPCDLHVLSAPPAFVLSQDQTLSFIPAPTGQKRSPKARRAETRHARDPSRRCQSRQPTAAACTSPLTQPPTMRKSVADAPATRVPKAPPARATALKKIAVETRREALDGPGPTDVKPLAPALPGTRPARRGDEPSGPPSQPARRRRTGI
jgi:hypothetical protein